MFQSDVFQIISSVKALNCVTPPTFVSINLSCRKSVTETAEKLTMKPMKESIRNIQ